MDNIKTVLENEGVNAKGFGMIFQAVMFDMDIPINSKTLYALLCSHLGSGTFVFPKRETILNYLNLSKNAYYKALRPLIDNGYISIRKAKGYINKNIYVINNVSSKVVTRPIISDDAEGVLTVDGIAAQGYGFIPKLIMIDPRLSVKSKALIALLYSLTAAGTCAYPHRETLCVSLGISKNTYYKALNQLIEFNYIEVHQRRQNKGRFTVNDYTLVTNPNQEKINESETIVTAESPCLKNEDNAKNGTDCGSSPCLKNGDNTDAYRVSKTKTLPCLKNEDINNSIRNNSNIDSMKCTANSIVSTPIQTADDDVIIRTKINSWIGYENIISTIKEADGTENPFVKSSIVAMKNILAVSRYLEDLLRSEASPFVYRGTEMNRDRLINMLSGLSGEDVSEIIHETVYHFDICKNKYRIHDPCSYIKTLLIQHIENVSFDDDWWMD